MSYNAIEVNKVVMKFNLASEKTDSLKEYIVKLFQGKLNYEEFTALDDVSFFVKQGQVFGLIGANGSGKSTMLKCISGIYKPTKGSVSVKGMIAPLIELGAGFDPDLTARENVYLNGAVMGYSKKFMQEHFDEVIDFAELWKFLDVPIKNYSSGMCARLGFAVATVVKPDVLIVDEILAVGDLAFQNKCYKKMEELRTNGTTMLFVSHDLDKVQEICDSVVWLNHGKKIMEGSTEKVVGAYREWIETHTAFE